MRGLRGRLRGSLDPAGRWLGAGRDGSGGDLCRTPRPTGRGAGRHRAAGYLLAAIGRWPASLSWGNARVGFANEIRNEIAEALSTAPASARPTLERIRERVSTIEAEQTPRVAAAIAYDDEVERAMHRVVHGAVLRRESQWSRDRADFWLVVGDHELYIETKYVGSSMTFAAAASTACSTGSMEAGGCWSSPMPSTSSGRASASRAVSPIAEPS